MFTLMKSSSIKWIKYDSNVMKYITIKNSIIHRDANNKKIKSYGPNELVNCTFSKS